MGRIFDALQRSTREIDGAEPVMANFAVSARVVERAVSGGNGPDNVRPVILAPTPEQRLVTLAGPRSLGSEKIRILAAKLRHMQDQRLLKRLLITSSVKDEGKTALSANLAISFARMKQRVLFIDGDCHQASAARLFGLKSSAGLTDWYRSDAPIENFMRKVEGLSLWFLPAGRAVDQPAEMLQSQRIADLLASWSAQMDWIVIDSPPCAPLADAAIWAKMAEGILLVARDARTPKRLLRKVVDSLDRNKLLGIVLNDCSDRDQQYYATYYNIHKNH